MRDKDIPVNFLESRGTIVISMKIETCLVEVDLEVNDDEYGALSIDNMKYEGVGRFVKLKSNLKPYVYSLLNIDV